MTREDAYMLGCLSAVEHFINSGSSYFSVKVNGKWEKIPWAEICDWIKKNYAIEVEE